MTEHISLDQDLSAGVDPTVVSAQAAESIRVLNHTDLSRPAEPGALYFTAGNLATMLNRLPQALTQYADLVDRWIARGRIGHDNDAAAPAAAAKALRNTAEALAVPNSLLDHAVHLLAGANRPESAAPEASDLIRAWPDEAAVSALLANTNLGDRMVLRNTLLNKIDEGLEPYETADELANMPAEAREKLEHLRALSAHIGTYDA